MGNMAGIFTRLPSAPLAFGLKCMTTAGLTRPNCKGSGVTLALLGGSPKFNTS